MRVRVTLFTRFGEPRKTSLSEFCPDVASAAFERSVLAHKREARAFAVNVGHPAALPAVLTVALLTRLLKLAGVRVVMTETAVGGQLDRLYFGKSCAFERDLMTLIAS
jgi:hypothetical protein